MTRLLFLFGCGLMFLAATSTRINAALPGLPSYDLADDWSDAVNPNGPWALYKAPGQLFTVNQPDWYSNASNQRAWADEPYPGWTHVPMWAKAIGDIGSLFDPIYTAFINAGQIYMHSAESIRTGTELSSLVWTSPQAGMVRIHGGTWVNKAFDRPQLWELKLNGTLLSSGILAINDAFTKDDPYTFEDGTGGPSAVLLPVSVGDQIELVVSRTLHAPYGTLVGVELEIQFVPEAAGAALASLAIGSTAAGRSLRRKRS